jgi:hypothetical protein
LDTVTPETGFVCRTETGVIDPKAELALTNKAAVASDSERIRFAVFPVTWALEAMLFSFSIDSSIHEILI